MKKVLLSVFLVAVVAGGVAWSERIEVLLAVVKYTSANEHDIAENRTIPWQQGPAAVTDEEQPPNIILIVADDLGFNDISTFGGGVSWRSSSRPPALTGLAAEGAVFRPVLFRVPVPVRPPAAMMMTGRYPARTGFEFTPTPSGMGENG